MSMTGQFEVSKIEIVARLAEHLIPLARQAASAGIPLEAPPSSEEGEILVLTADGKGVPLVKQDAQRLGADFEIVGILSVWKLV